MATKPVTFRVDFSVDEAITQRSGQLGFAKPSDYLKSLIRYDLLVGKPHDLTRPLADLSPDEQSRVDDQIARAFKAGETSGGTFLENVVARAVEAAAAPAPPPPSVVTQKLRSILKHQREKATV